MRSTTEAAEASSSIFSTPKWPSSRRTHSLSSSSLSSSSTSSSVPPSPATPLRRYSGGGGGRIPFSWESIPGIPKIQILKKLETSRNNNTYLPLPPAAKSSQKNYSNATATGKSGDPFFAALVECSKGGDEGGDKAVFGSVMPKTGGRNLFMSSCKNASDIAESLVFLPRGERTRRIGYEIVKK